MKYKLYLYYIAGLNNTTKHHTNGPFNDTSTTAQPCSKSLDRFLWSERALTKATWLDLPQV